MTNNTFKIRPSKYMMVFFIIISFIIILAILFANMYYLNKIIILVLFTIYLIYKYKKHCKSDINIKTIEILEFPFFKIIINNNKSMAKIITSKTVMSHNFLSLTFQYVKNKKQESILIFRHQMNNEENYRKLARWCYLKG